MSQAQARGRTAQRNIYRGQVERMGQGVANDEALANMSQVALATRMAALDESYAQFLEAHIVYTGTLPEDTEENQALLAAVEDQYFAAKIRIGERVMVHNEARQVQEAERELEIRRQQPPPPPPAQLVPQEKPEVGQFDGNYAAWPEFRGIFVAEVHETEMSDVKKMKELRKACIGQAKDVIGKWMIVGENYQQAWNRLCEVYDDDYRTKQDHIDAIFQLKPLPKETYDGLREIVNTVNGALAQLAALNVPINGWDVMIIHAVLARLPGQTRAAWEAHRQDHAATVAELMTFLGVRAKGRRGQPTEANYVRHGGDEHLQRSHRADQSRPFLHKRQFQSQPRPYQRFPEQNRARSESQHVHGGRGTSLMCAMCKANHRLEFCPAFNKLDVDERSKRARSWGMCLNCFLENHRTLDCKRNGCPNCGGKHHKILCFRMYGRKLTAASVSVPFGQKRGREKQ